MPPNSRFQPVPKRQKKHFYFSLLCILSAEGRQERYTLKEQRKHDGRQRYLSRRQRFDSRGLPECGHLRSWAEATRGLL